MCREQQVKILLIDDSVFNRGTIKDILCDKYTIIEKDNADDAISYIEENRAELSLILLDLIMPKKDGYEVLKFLKYNEIKDIPVIVISTEDRIDKIRTAYKLGAIDYITKPYDYYIIHTRIENTLLSHIAKRNLKHKIVNQQYKNNTELELLVTILSKIVESKNGESGLHVQNIKKITKFLLEKLLLRKTDYGIKREDIPIICLASALHDIGKITIPDEIINKEGPLTEEEFSEVKKHSAAGADLLASIETTQNEPLLKYATEICRWHHERYDGRGYPDRLTGDRIPISVQVVAIADVFDALTSKRCYKEAYAPHKAIDMILNGECGSFNPELLECLKEFSEDIIKTVADKNISQDEEEAQILLSKKSIAEDNSFTDLIETLEQLSTARKKIEFLTENIEEIIFSYNKKHKTIRFSNTAANLLKLKSTTFQYPTDCKELFKIIDMDFKERLVSTAKQLTPTEPYFNMRCSIKLNGKTKKMHIKGLGIFSEKDSIEYTDFICLMSEEK